MKIYISILYLSFRKNLLKLWRIFLKKIKVSIFECINADIHRKNSGNIKTNKMITFILRMKGGVKRKFKIQLCF